MYQEFTVAVVIPAYQEECLIGTTLKGLPTWVDEVIVIDDASYDQTSKKVSALYDILPFPLHLIQHTHNQGVGQSILDGYKKAFQLKCDVAVVMGADAQMDPLEMPALLDHIVQPLLVALHLQIAANLL